MGDGRRDGRNVLMLSHGGATLRGTEACAIGAGHAFAEAGHRLYVARNSSVIDRDLGPVAEEFLDFDFPEIMLDRAHYSLPLVRFVRAYRSLTRMLDRFAIDVIYTSGGLPCQLGVPAARSRGLPVLCHFHHPAPRRYYYLWLVPLADRVVFPSQFTRDHSVARAPIRGEVVYNGIDLERFRPVARHDARFRALQGLPSDAIVVGQVGQLVPHKRPDHLLEVFSRLAPHHPRLHLCLVGGGPLLPELQEGRHRLGLEGRIALTGYVDDVLPFYQNVIDINVSVSREEGLGLSILEGAACGLPSVVCNAGGLAETVMHGETGYVVDAEDSRGLARHIVSLSSNPDLRSQLGRAGRKMVEEKFDQAGYRRNMIDQLHAALSRNVP